MKPKIPPGVFSNPSDTTTKHDEMLLLYTKDSMRLRELISVILRKQKVSKYILQEWIPEKTITNQSNYYIGSVDLFLSVDIPSYDEFLKKEFFKRIYILIEFKPKIISFSETLRQVSVYKKYLGTPIFPIVITYSDISKFKDIFESQNIELIQLKK